MEFYTKRIINHPDLYIASFSKNRNLPCLVFIHGGPGLNSGILAYLIEHEHIFDALEFDIVLYDQRGCGRSRSTNQSVSHRDNLNDLNDVCSLIKKHCPIAAIIGHSYGAKLLFDYFYNNQNNNIPGIFLSTAASILTPRINNLLIDLLYLKTIDQALYQTILRDFDDMDHEKMWALTMKLDPVFQSNTQRPYLYWANLESKEKTQQIQDKINLPRNHDIFVSVREDLYAKSGNHSVDIHSISNVPCLWINGFHDFIMNSAENALSTNQKITTFYKSAHYPHIEESERFVQVINNFLIEKK